MTPEIGPRSFGTFEQQAPGDDILRYLIFIADSAFLDHANISIVGLPSHCPEMS